MTDSGDHVAICEVIGTGVWDENKQTVAWQDEGTSENQSALGSSTALYSGELRDERGYFLIELKVSLQLHFIHEHQNQNNERCTIYPICY